MAKKNSFWLEIGGGAGVLQDMAQEVVKMSADAICDRANSIYGQKIFLPTGIIVGKAPTGGGTPRAWVAVRTNKPHVTDHMYESLIKARPAGKVGK